LSAGCLAGTAEGDCERLALEVFRLKLLL
jgi:hypothetical protein